jgi:hypothetical protein
MVSIADNTGDHGICEVGDVSILVFALRLS